MLLRRSKKKLKKAQQLQEAARQQAYLASLQQNASMYKSLLPGMTMNGGLFERDEEFLDGSSGSDPDGEMLDQISHQSFPAALLQHQQPKKNSPPYSGGANTLPALHVQPLSAHQQQQFTFSSSVANNINAGGSSTGPAVPNTPTRLDHSFKRGLSQPLFTSIPATVAEVQSSTPPPPLPATVSSSQQQQTATTVQQQSASSTNQQSYHVRQRSSLGGSPKSTRVKKQSTEKTKLINTSLAFGLGRGIDATNKTPWLNKKSYQIRRVHNSVIETNEGGIQMNYDHEMLSTADSEEEFLSSLSPPESTVTIHIEDELDRTVSSTRRVVGRRVINRSIGFQADFEEKYADGEVSKLNKESVFIPKDPAEMVYNTQTSGFTFEERVCQWLLHRIAQKCGLNLHKTDENPVDLLAKLFHAKSAQNVEKEVNVGCHELIQGLKVTHYITELQLGALEYRIMSNGQYHKKMAVEGAFGIDKLTSAFSSEQTKMNRKELKKCSQLRQIGKIENDHVAKDTQDEAVLQVRVQPITRLIKLPMLKLALTRALEKYMEGTPSSEGGPFVIKCTGRDLYLTVNKFNNYEVEATDVATEASLFYFQTTDEGGNPFEFHIAYYGEDADPNDKTTEGSTVCRYLEAPLNPQGRCPGPLLMKHSVKIKNTRYTLRSRLSKKNSKSHLAEWMAGEDAFYIACATKKYQHGSYLAIKNIKNTRDLIGKHFYMTYCDSTIHSHNGENVMMLFQLYTKEAIMSKAGTGGRETPGRLPMLQSAKEIILKDADKTSPGLVADLQ